MIARRFAAGQHTIRYGPQTQTEGSAPSRLSSVYSLADLSAQPTKGRNSMPLLQSGEPGRAFRALVRLSLFVCLCIGASSLAAGAVNQEPIRYLPQQKLWVLATERTSYVLGINERDQLQHVY